MICLTEIKTKHLTQQIYEKNPIFITR